MHDDSIHARAQQKGRREELSLLIGEIAYLQSMDFQREPQSKHHPYCEQEKPAHCHGSLLLRLGTHQIQNRTRDAHKISPHGTMTKRTPAMNWDHAVSWGGGLG